MRLLDGLTKRLTPRVTALCGVGSLVCLAGGLAVAYARFPGYSLWTGYISELAKHTNPGRWGFVAALATAGPLIALFALGLHGLMENRPGRIAARLLTVTGLAMPVVASFDLTWPVPHFTAAAALFGSAVLGTVFAGVGFRRMAAAAEPARARTLRLGAGLAFATFGLQVASTVGGFIYTGILVARMNVVSANQLLKDLPKHQKITFESGFAMNPVALLEWIFLLTAAVLIGLMCLYALRQARAASPREES